MSRAVAAGGVPALSPRTLVLLEGPLVPTLVRMAWPNLLVSCAQAATGLVETYWIARLGTDALAGMALVFPAVMLMQMISGGAMGGGIASAVARALGAGRRDEANAIVTHALIVNALLAIAFSAIALVFGRALYGALGGHGASLAAALLYSNVIFAGNILLWTMNALASVLRGTGNMMVPSLVICGGVIVLVPLSPCLIFGIGPFPALGVAGGAVALLGYYAVGTAILAWYIRSGRSVVAFVRARPNAATFVAILRVGGVASLIALQTNITIALTTGIVGSVAGPAAIAGFGTGARLEYLLIPIAFGIGAPLVALVGTNLGAGNAERARAIAWTGAAITFALTEAVGVCAAIWPHAWLGLFGVDPRMLAAGTAYLRAVGPFYGCFGLGMALYFSSQGAGRLAWPLLAGVSRMLVAVVGGYAVFRATGSLAWLYPMLGIALVVFGAINAGAVARGSLRALDVPER